MPRRLHAAGFTLVELAVTLTVLTVLATATWPAMSALADRHRIRGAAAIVADDLQYARSAALARAEAVRFTVPPDGRCHLVHTGPSDACGCGQACSPSAELLKKVDWPDGTGIRLHLAPGSLRFDPVLGTSTPTGTVQVSSRSGVALHQVVNLMGRVRTCAPKGQVAGHAAC